MHIVYIIHKSIKKYAGIPLIINMGEVLVLAQPEPDSIIQNPVPVKLEPDLIFKYPDPEPEQYFQNPVPVSYNPDPVIP